MQNLSPIIPYKLRRILQIYNKRSFFLHNPSCLELLQHMCGIFYYKGLGLNTSEIETWFMRTQHRGPDNSRQIQIEDRFFGFHRLRIVGLSEAGDQPFRMGNCVLVCNGEIYNHKELAAEHGFPVTTGSDCEVIVHMYKKFGPEFSHMLTGVFAFVLYDE
jgi:asparagine synthase (glutamine-hydrolysing)